LASISLSLQNFQRENKEIGNKEIGLLSSSGINFRDVL
jgi:hypothetical protein